MIPEKGKTYQIDYWFQCELGSEEEETFYKGEAVYTGEAEKDHDGNILYFFNTPNNIFNVMFAEEDIIKEIIK